MKAKVTAFIGSVSGTVEVECVSIPVPGIEKIEVFANPQSMPGVTSEITAIVTNTEGNVVADGTAVYFITNSGTLSASSANTNNGIATVSLTLD